MKLESAEEKAFYKWAKKQGYECLKIQLKKGWPDRLLLCKNAVAVFFEFKRSGEVPSNFQYHIHAILRKLGFLVFVVYSSKEAQELLCHVLKQRTKQTILPSKPGKNSRKPKKIRH